MSDSSLTPWTVAYQVPLSVGFPGLEYWSGLLFPSPGDLPDAGIEPESPALHVSSLSPGAQIYPSFFRIPFKGVRLELLTPICKREKSDQYHLSTGGVPPCSRWGCRQTVHQSFSFLVRLSLSLTVSGATLVPPRSTTETGWGCTRGRPDGIPDCHPALHH